MTTPFIIFVFYFIVILLIVRRFKGRINNTSPRDVSSGYGQSDIVRKAMSKASKTPTDTLINRPVNALSFSNEGRPADDRIRLKNSSGKKGLSLMDDRSSDWLATQLREEARAMVKVSAMFQLKEHHANNCDAEFIKRFHESNCDAGSVDDGLKK